jgi:hypothetical protein
VIKKDENDWFFSKTSKIGESLMLLDAILLWMVYYLIDFDSDGECEVRPPPCGDCGS